MAALLSEMIWLVVVPFLIQVSNAETCHSDLSSAGAVASSVLQRGKTAWTGGLLQHMHSSMDRLSGLMPALNHSKWTLSKSQCKCQADLPLSHAPTGSTAHDSTMAQDLPPCLENSTPVEAVFAYNMWREDKCFLSDSSTAQDPACIAAEAGSSSVHHGNRQIYVLGDSKSVPLYRSLRMATNLPLMHTARQAGYVKEGFQQDKHLVNQALRSGDVLMFAVCSYHYDSALLQDVHRFATQNNLTLVVYVDAPSFESHARDCVHSAGSNGTAGCTTSLEKYRKQLKPTRDAIKAIEHLSGVLVIDMFEDLFCSSGQCEIMVPGTDMPAFFDHQHLCQYGIEYIAPFLCSKLRELAIY